MAEDRRIARNNFDIFFRTSMQQVFRHDALASIDIITAPIVRALPSDIPTIKTTDQRVDALFELQNNTLLHLEFQTVTSSKRDLIRFLEYATHIFRKYDKPCETFVIYGADVEVAPSVLEISSTSSFRVHNIFLSTYDGDSLFHSLKERIFSGVKLTPVEEMQLTLLPLMNSKQDKRERALRACDLALELSSEKLQARIVASLLVVTNKWLDGEDAKIYLRRLRNMKVIELAYEEGREEGREKGREEGRKVGREEGRVESRIDMAIDLLRDGMEASIVAKYTRLSLEKVEELKKEL